MSKPSSRQLLESFFQSALQAADPFKKTLENMRLEGDGLTVGAQRFELDKDSRIFLLSAGKASVAMAKAAHEVLGKRLEAGAVILLSSPVLSQSLVAPSPCPSPTRGEGTLGQHVSNHPHPLAIVSPPLMGGEQGAGDEIVSPLHYYPATHPLPSEASLHATQKALHSLRNIRESDVLLFLFSGGASAMMEWPEEGIAINDTSRTTELLLKSGADIFEMNAVRKHLSRVKGGKLLNFFPEEVRHTTLLVSDVTGDDPSAIASGPTARDLSTFADAWAVVEKYGLEQELPFTVSKHLKLGLEGLRKETMKAALPQPAIIASNKTALDAMRKAAEAKGFRVVTLPPISGDVEKAAQTLWERFEEERKKHPNSKILLLAGGEVTLRVTGNGKGGRCQHFALLLARLCKDTPGVSGLCAGTDGIDGNSPAAGAFFDSSTCSRAQTKGLSPQTHLDACDSFAFFDTLDDNLVTGATGTNVQDVYLIAG